MRSLAGDRRACWQVCRIVVLLMGHLAATMLKGFVVRWVEMSEIPKGDAFEMSSTDEHC